MLVHAWYNINIIIVIYRVLGPEKIKQHEKKNPPRILLPIEIGRASPRITLKLTHVRVRAHTLDVSYLSFTLCLSLSPSLSLYEYGGVQ